MEKLKQNERYIEHMDKFKQGLITEIEITQEEEKEFEEQELSQKIIASYFK